MLNLFSGNTELSAFGEIPADHAVGIFVGTALPWAVRVCEVDPHLCLFAKQSVPCHLTAAVVGQAQLHLLR